LCGSKDQCHIFNRGKPRDEGFQLFNTFEERSDGGSGAKIWNRAFDVLHCRNEETNLQRRQNIPFIGAQCKLGELCVHVYAIATKVDGERDEM
jgi:hypothetical protein